MNEEEELKVIKHVFNTYGPLLSIKKDVEIINFFRSESKKEIRQKTVIKIFSTWAPETVRKHLRSLVKRGILEASSEFRGTYRFPPRGKPEFFSDMDILIEALVGTELYSMAKISWEEKLKNEDHSDRYR